MTALPPAANLRSVKPDREFRQLTSNAELLRLAGELLIFFLLASAAVIAFLIDDPGPRPLPFGGTIDIPTELSGALGGQHGIVNAHGFLERSRLLPRDNHALTFLTIPVFLSGLLGVMTRRWPAVIGSAVVLAAISLLTIGAPRFQGACALNLLIIIAGIRYALIERTVQAVLIGLLAFACLYASPLGILAEEAQRRQGMQNAIITEKSAMKRNLEGALAAHVAKGNDKIAQHVDYVLAQLAYHAHKREAARWFLGKLGPSAPALTPHAAGRLEEIKGFASRSANAAARTDDNYVAFYVVAVATVLVIALSLLLKGQADAILRRIDWLRSSAIRLGELRMSPRSSIEVASLDKLKLRELAIRRAAIGCLVFALSCIFVASEAAYHLFWVGGAFTDIALTDFAYGDFHAVSRAALLFHQPLNWGATFSIAATFAAAGVLIYTIVKRKPRALVPLVAALGLGLAHEQYFAHFYHGPGSHVGRARVAPGAAIDVEKLGKQVEAKLGSFWVPSVSPKMIAADVHFAVAQLAYLHAKPAVAAFHFKKLAELDPEGDGFPSHRIVRLHTWLRDNGYVVDLPLRPTRLRDYRAASTATLLHLLISIPGLLLGLAGLVLAELIRRTHRRVETMVQTEVSVDRARDWLASRNLGRTKDAKPIP